MDEFGELEEFETVSLNLNLEESDNSSTEQSDSTESNDFLDTLLKSRGIEDSSKIKFEDDNGDIEERPWDNLTTDEKINIINSGNGDPESDLDEDEIALINAIRTNKMSPKEYLSSIVLNGIDLYVEDSQNNQYVYSIDAYTDDLLFVADLISRMPNITDDEAKDALEQAKSNETLYAKQIEAIRNEYKNREDEMNLQAAFENEQRAQADYLQFSQGVALQIEAFHEFAGYDLNMDDEDMLQLFDFVTGVDGAGVNHFAKALSDPKTLVRTAYLALNGKQMIEDIDRYYKNEITKVRDLSYKKGLEDGKNNGPSIVYKLNKKPNLDPIWDLDDF